MVDQISPMWIALIILFGLGVIAINNTQFTYPVVSIWSDIGSTLDSWWGWVLKKLKGGHQ